MVGTSNEINLEVEGIKTCGLLDTGSQVTTVAQWFVREKLPKFEVESVENFLNPFSPSVLYKGRQLLLPSFYTESHYF